MKYISLTLLFLWTISIHIFSQIPDDPCGEIRRELIKINKLIIEEQYDQAIELLHIIKENPTMSECEEMKIVDSKIQQYPQWSGPINILGCSGYKHPHAINLGLPSGTKWACCNVGATSPENTGGYYAWGETEGKKEYNWNTYIHCDGTEVTCHIIGESISGTQYDVAYMKWGSQWTIPTYIQFSELEENCNIRWTNFGGVEGRLYTSKLNGKSIFIPAAGFRSGNLLNDIEYYSIYWTGSKNSEYDNYAISYSFIKPFSFENHIWGPDAYYARCYGHSVRPVTK